MAGIVVLHFIARSRRTILDSIATKNIACCFLVIRSSCKDIRDSGDFKGDGEYWIDPEKSGKPFKVFCNMTSDGGKFHVSVVLANVN